MNGLAGIVSLREEARVFAIGCDCDAPCDACDCDAACDACDSCDQGGDGCGACDFCDSSD